VDSFPKIPSPKHHLHLSCLPYVPYFSLTWSDFPNNRSTDNKAICFIVISIPLLLRPLVSKYHLQHPILQNTLPMLFSQRHRPTHSYKITGTNTRNIVIIIIIFLHGLGRLNCSDIDSLPSFPGASTISSSSGFVVEGVFRESVVIHSFKVVDPITFVFGSYILYSRDL